MRRKKILIACLSVFAVLVLASALLPTLASGYARSRIEREIAARVQGTVALGSVELGWFGPQRVTGLRIDGGAGIGTIALSLEVGEGLLSLVQGSDITLTLAGDVRTVFDAEGRPGLAGLVKPMDSSMPDPPVSDPSVPDSARGDGDGADAGAVAGGSTPLGARTLRVMLDALDLSATGPDSAEYALDDLEGELVMVGPRLEITLTAATRASGRTGELDIDGTLDLAFGASGGVDLAETTGTMKVSAGRVALPTAAGELWASTLLVEVAKSDAGDVEAKVDLVARLAGSDEATVRADIAFGAPFGADGGFALDPASVTATVEAHGVPMAALQPFAPEIAPGVALSLAEDIGEVADLTVVKQQGDRARVSLEAQQLRLAFDGAVAPDGSSIDGGTLTASLALRPALLAALGLVDAEPLRVALQGERIAWRREADFARSIGGTMSLALSEPFGCTAPGDVTRLQARAFECSVSKDLGAPVAQAVVELEGAYGAAGETSLSASGTLDLASAALASGALDATMRIDPATVERLTGGAVSARGRDASLRISFPEVSYLPSDEFDGIRALVLRGGIELEGALGIEGAGTAAAVSDLAVELETPRSGRAGTLRLVSRIDGAQVRVEQRFGPIPKGALDPAALGLTGSVRIEGLDPSVLARLSPELAGSTGLLGHGELRLEATNRSERGALVADFALDAAAIDASGSVRYEADAIDASNLVVDATLTAEALASLELGPDIALEPGTRISLRAPSFALSRAGASGAWTPTRDLAARVVVEGFRVLRAPGVVAPIGVAKLDATASYAFAEERALVQGNATLGGGGTAGALEFGLSWRKPVEAKLFRGVEGTIALANFDLARFEPSFGLEAGAYSGILGGMGSARIEIAERTAPTASVVLGFPKTNGRIALEFAEADGLAESDGRRELRIGGSIVAEIAAETVAKLAGLARDPSRRVLEPVTVSVEIASASVPLDTDMKPDPSPAAFDLRGSMSPLVLEAAAATGEKVRLSTGALSLSATSRALGEEVALRVRSTEAGAAGSLTVDATLRGVVGREGRDAAPSIDATVRAVRFPAATIDMLAATGGAVGRYLGDAIDAEVDAVALSAAGGSLSARLRSPFATLDAPSLSIADGMLRVSGEQPVLATFEMSPAVREQLLASINPVFSDVTTGAPARFTLAELAWPLDGDRSRFDARFALETGEVRLVNSGTVSGLLTLASAGRTEGFEAFLEPLRGEIAKGRLTYRDFVLRAGKTSAGAWRNSIVFEGDIDLAAKPIRANSITTAVPLADAANWSRDAREIVSALSAASPELVRTLAVGVEMSGPLFDPAGKPIKPTTRVKMPDVGDALKDNPGAILDAAGGIIDIFRKKKAQPPQQP